MSDVWDADCSRLGCLGCWMFEIQNVWMFGILDVCELGYGMLEMLNVWDGDV